MSKTQIPVEGYLRCDFHAPITVGGITFPTAEHAFQAAKTADRDLKEEISQGDVHDAKNAGRNIPLNSAEWDKNRSRFMEFLIRMKFFTHLELQEQLVDSGTAEIVMTGRDKFWGVDVHGNGKNELGKILMRVREEAQFATGWEPEPKQVTDDPIVKHLMSDDGFGDELPIQLGKMYAKVKELTAESDLTDHFLESTTNSIVTDLKVITKAIEKHLVTADEEDELEDESGEDDDGYDFGTPI